MATALPTFLDSMKCPICLDFAQNAVETVCCAQVYCEKCVEDLVGYDCPSCREPNLETSISRIARRTIGELPVECPNACGETVTRATLEEHKELCPKREYECPIAECEFSGLFQHLADHAAAKHPKDVASSLNKAFGETITVEIENVAKKEKAFNCPFDECQDEGETTKGELLYHLREFHANDRDDFLIEAKAFRCHFGTCNQQLLTTAGRMSRQAVNDHVFQVHNNEWSNKILNPRQGPITVVNSEGRNASMAPNGKFYCGREDGADTTADDTRRVEKMPCTPESKLNCRSCMKLDVSLRNLPYGSLVNGAGHVARPLFCNHDVKGSEYFATSFRTALCSYVTCGNVPYFTCNMPDVTRHQNQLCSLKHPCKECSQINFVYGVHFSRDKDVKEDINYYGYVWEKQ